MATSRMRRSAEREGIARFIGIEVPRLNRPLVARISQARR
jgi:hypothetical protein